MVLLTESFCTIDWEKLARFLSALLTPVLAGVTAYIAYQQRKTNERQVQIDGRQLRLALFDKRWKVFEAVTAFIGGVLRTSNVSLDELYNLLREASGHEFLFGPDIKQYIDELYSKGVELETYRAAQTNNPPQLTALLSWFSGQSNNAREKFGKYMEFKEPE